MSKIDYIIFHIFLPENKECVIKGYLDILTRHGLYDEVEEIFVYMKYTDISTLMLVLKMFEDYSKIKILHCEHNDDTYSSFIQRQLKMPTPNGVMNPAITRLGEGETLMRMFDDPLLKVKMGKYKTGLFLNSKSISFFTDHNTRRIEGDHEDPEFALEVFIKRKKKFISFIDTYEKFNGNFGVQMFIFRSDWFKNITVSDYLESMWNLKNNIETLTEKNGEIKNVEKYFYGEYVEGLCRYSVLKTNNEYFVMDRHAFCKFPYKMNAIMGF